MLRFACDVGGTFTDLVIDDESRGLSFYKRPTTPDDPVRGLFDVISAAAHDFDVTVAELLARGDLFVHGTTRATNAIVTGNTARTAFLCTEGHPDTLLFREGGGRHPPLDYTQPYPDPYVPRRLTFEVPERIRADGSVSRPLDEEAVVEIARRIGGLDVEAVAVCLLWSIVNPAHEARVGEILDEHLPGIPYTLSHSLNPSLREYRRASSTAIDASLKPLMGRYMRELEGRLRDEGFSGRLLMLTSSGGVLDAAAVADTPIHAIGSGPAAAPVAGRHFARLDAESETAIVTDAGGTTYDVSLIRRGEIPWTRNTLVGDAPGYTTGFPSVDVRSIGAGGGSIAWVDDAGLLHVGPQSAGAVPGPACYGRGGTQATVTDACVVLGYIDPNYFLGGEMTLEPDRAAAAVETDVARPLGLDLHEAAAAVLDLACERMVTAIEEITLNQGIDPREAALVGGGGGAGLYSVAIARRLGAGSIVIPEVAAALSATGALLSELKRDFVSIDVTTSGAFDFDGVNAVLADLRGRCEEFLATAGSGSIETSIRLSVEARYPHQVWEVEVPIEGDSIATPDDVEELRRRFHDAHEQLFAISDRESQVEFVAWRASVSCTLRPTAPVASAEASAESPSTRTAYFEGGTPTETPVRRLAALAAGESVSGPAIIESPVTTIVVPPGATARRLESGSLAVDAGAAPASRPRRRTESLELALTSNRLEGAVRAMMNTILRTSRSGILNTGRDFSCCILTADAELLVVAESIPVHVFRGGDLMAAWMKRLFPDLKRGDAFLNNSPYHGNSHAADWSVLVPVIDDEGVHRFTVLTKAHLADCGNAIPTTYSADARDVYEEGALIYPCVKVQEDYRDREDVMRMAHTRIRVPELWHGDYLALLGAARIGERRLLELIDEMGAPTLEWFRSEWFDYSERRMMSAIARLPGGEATTHSRHDPIPSMPDGVPVKVTVSVDPDDKRIEVDLRDNLDCQPCGLNLSEATSTSAAMIGVFSSLGEPVPPNAGSYRRVAVHVRENCVVGIPRHPASCSAATTNLSEMVAKAVTLALAELGEGFGMGEVGFAQPPNMGVISGVDPRPNGGPYVNQLMLAMTGGAGVATEDAWLTLLGIGAAGVLLLDSVEIDEMKYPIEIRAVRIIPDSEGAGRFRGAPGAYVEYGPVDCAMEVVYLSDGTFTKPRGVRGGLPGDSAHQHKRSRDGSLSPELGCYARVLLEDGETIVSLASGGGGYGPPRERDPRRVAKDALEGWITGERAREVYLVALTEDGTVDEAATAKLRA
jgi:N-methylhydantoinase A/oxoprolinase/acetone carboxylase beta subunit/N-methylhydantoinase B/oxoprolinase/acetone carboxylase alpha subunit